jgi:hypothetical protein
LRECFINSLWHLDKPHRIRKAIDNTIPDRISAPSDSARPSCAARGPPDQRVARSEISSNANRSSPPAASASSDRKKPFVTELKNRGAREGEMLKAGFDPALLFDAKAGRRIRQRGRVIAEELIKPVRITLV